ncbi:MAG TPA: alginate lyase family protein [Geminicoccus sp.]|jgi:poly(beta-D-mannuronate) lyase|uniref:alginate lyase family protein n=1 Tax=Geminicoccus sp. TaxID=2024832 RepID=UPI002E3472D2|nr:alginate lyase family protein [Geminicoccus sp.]HEX2527417.1 alginate lyase family protein [Geminicoccus sp.]
MSRSALVGMSAWLACCCFGAAEPLAQALASPFDVANHAFPRAAAKSAPCPATPAVVRDLDAMAYYADPAGSQPDEAKRQRNREIVKPLNVFTDLVLQQSDLFMATGSSEAAGCALGLLQAWAEGGALEGELTTQGQFHRNWSTNAFATAFLIVRSAPGLDTVAKEEVQDWLARLCTLDQTLAERVSNNHLLWCAASCATAGIASGRNDQLDWAIATAEQALDEVTEQGVLPREAARGARALAYHNFALEALVVVAEMAGANGRDLYRHHDEALRRLANFVIRNAADPAEAAELAGVPQSWSGATSGRFVWAEPYYRRFRDPRLKELLKRLRPMRHAFFGGNATLMYGVHPLEG